MQQGARIGGDGGGGCLSVYRQRDNCYSTLYLGLEIATLRLVVDSRWYKLRSLPCFLHFLPLNAFYPPV